MTKEQTTFSGVLGDSRCECADPICPAHLGQSHCGHVATAITFVQHNPDNHGQAREIVAVCNQKNV